MYNSINYKMWPKWSFRDWREIRDEIQILSTLIYITVIFNPLLFELHLFEEKAYVILNSIYNSLELYPVPLSGMKIQIAIHWRTSASCQLRGENRAESIVTRDVKRRRIVLIAIRGGGGRTSI